MTANASPSLEIANHRLLLVSTNLAGDVEIKVQERFGRCHEERPKTVFTFIIPYTQRKAFEKSISVPISNTQPHH